LLSLTASFAATSCKLALFLATTQQRHFPQEDQSTESVRYR
jgi:hypothetical protein